MRIAFLAMSGVRAYDAELTALGLTLPGFLERGKIIASLPSLGLLYLAAATPAGHSLQYFEADACDAVPAGVFDADLVAISTFSAQVFEAYTIADRLRSAGVKVAMGGLHVAVCPDEALQHADYVIVGEGESVWPAVVASAEAGEAPRRFDSGDYPPVDVAALPVPRYDLLRGEREYNRLTVQTSRGCPWRCDFCASTIMLGRPYRKRPVEHVARDIAAIQSIWPEPFIEFADDNTFVDKAWGRRLCDAIALLGVKWFTETDITVADDDDLLDRIAAAGCRQLLIGLESPTRDGLEGIELHGNAKARWAGRYADAVRRIQSHGITVNGCFVLGLDGHTPAVFDSVRQFADDVGLYDVQITVMTPFPDTPLYDRLSRAGRILSPGRWDLCTLFDVNYEPTHMSVAELRGGLVRLASELYSDEGTRRRRRVFFRQSRNARHRQRGMEP
jgi:radical SAM superfamily enzyme YgiQ (UPF0313 family)